MSAVEKTIEELRGLPEEKFRKAAEVIHSLKEESLRAQNEGLEELFGCITQERAEQWWNDVKTDCRRVVPNE